MLRTDKPVYRVILLLNLLLIVAGFIFSVIGFTETAGNIAGQIMNALQIVTLAFAAFYIVCGYGKNASHLYRLFASSFAASVIAAVVNVSVNGSDAFAPLELCLMLTVILVLLFGENPGKKRSFALCGILVLLGAASVVSAAVGGNADSVIAASVRLALVCLYGIMTYAKYLDKTERGSE